MATDMYIKIGSIKGESKDAGHKDEIDITGWNWGMSQSGSMHAAGGGGAGRVNVEDLTFTKYIDASTPILMKFCATGEHINEVVLTMRKAGKTQLEYVKITLKKALISSLQTGGEGDQDRLTETIGLNFASYEIEYTPQDDQGAGSAAINSGYDIEANQEI